VIHVERLAPTDRKGGEGRATLVGERGGFLFPVCDRDKKGGTVTSREGAGGRESDRVTRERETESGSLVISVSHRSTNWIFQVFWVDKSRYRVI